jgi:hypothetical protein
VSGVSGVDGIWVLLDATRGPADGSHAKCLKWIEKNGRDAQDGRLVELSGLSSPPPPILQTLNSTALIPARPEELKKIDHYAALSAMPKIWDVADAGDAVDARDVADPADDPPDGDEGVLVDGPADSLGLEAGSSTSTPTPAPVSTPVSVPVGQAPARGKHIQARRRKDGPTLREEARKKLRERLDEKMKENQGQGTSQGQSGTASRDGSVVAPSASATGEEAEVKVSEGGAQPPEKKIRVNSASDDRSVLGEDDTRGELESQDDRMVL